VFIIKKEEEIPLSKTVHIRRWSLNSRHGAPLSDIRQLKLALEETLAG
jgi:hypothetical protein